MLAYLTRRFLYAIPTLILISMVAFGLRQCSPVEPVEQIYGELIYLKETDPSDPGRKYASLAQELGIDKPVFYFSIRTAAFPDTLNTVYPLNRRQVLINLTQQTGNWDLVAEYEQALWQAIRIARLLPDSFSKKKELNASLAFLRYRDNLEAIDRELAVLQPISEATQVYENWAVSAGYLWAAAKNLKIHKTPLINLIPVVYWNGFDNQYHNWAKGFINGEMGRSLKTSRPVWEELYPALLATLAVNSMSIFLAYLLAVPLGVWLAKRRQKNASHWIQMALLVLDAIPVFLLGALFMLFFATPGMGLHLIRGIDLPSWRGSGLYFIEWFFYNFDKFFLPVITISLSLMALIAQQMRGSMLDALAADYIRTAQAKGLPPDMIYWHHAFRNALFPIITLLSAALPALISGSLVIEYLFNLPGLGRTTYDSFHYDDVPMLMAILMLYACLTVVGALLADILYAAVDPRVKFRK